MTGGDERSPPVVQAVAGVGGEAEGKPWVFPGQLVGQRALVVGDARPVVGDDDFGLQLFDDGGGPDILLAGCRLDDG